MARKKPKKTQASKRRRTTLKNRKIRASMKERVPYTKKELDALAERIIARGKDIDFMINGKKYTLDIKQYAAEREYYKKRL